jgi:ABC-2 type transport system permease protein
MPIAELGYRPWQGQRTGVHRRWLAIARTEIAIAWQNSKLLRRFVIFAWIPILYFCPFFLAVGYVANPENDLNGLLPKVANEVLGRDGIERLRERPELVVPALWSIAFYLFLAYTQSLFAMFVVAIVGPPLIAKDLRSKAFLVYFSKPIRSWQYLLGKLGTIVFFVCLMTLFPALVLYLLGIALSPNLATAGSTLPILLRIAAASAVIAIPVGFVALTVSALTKNRRVATFTWVGVWICGEIAFRVLTIGASFGNYDGVAAKPPTWPALLSLRELTTRATAGILEVREQTTWLLDHFGNQGSRLAATIRDIGIEMGDQQFLQHPGMAKLAEAEAGSGLAPGVAIAALALISIVCAGIVRHRILQPVRI